MAWSGKNTLGRSNFKEIPGLQIEKNLKKRIGEEFKRKFAGQRVRGVAMGHGHYI